MAPTTRSLRVLLIAEACNPGWVSVPLEGWSHSKAIRHLANAHLVTQIRNREALLGEGLAEEIDFTSIDSERLAKPMHRLAEILRGGAGKGWTTLTAISALTYPYFEHLVWKKFSERLRSGEFDLVHRITPLSPTAPSLLAKKCREIGIPFVMGPLNGGVPWPKGFESARRREREWLSYVRNGYKLLPGYRSTRKNASAILIGSRDTWDQMPQEFHHKCFYIPENAIDPERFPLRRLRTAEAPLRIVFVGRLVPYKGADMLLAAAAPLIRNGKVHVTIIGDGPMMQDLKQQVRVAGCESGVHFLGWLPQRELQNHLINSDLLGFPSIREFGGGVVLEAMAVGVAPIVVNYGGPGELVTDQTGYRLELGTRDQIIVQLYQLLCHLLENPGEIDMKGKASMERVERGFTWAAKAREVLKVYQWVMDPSSERPIFPMPTPDLAEPR
jgi:glycosyltransferase involved in cell wall biosynthesis